MVDHAWAMAKRKGIERGYRTYVTDMLRGLYEKDHRPSRWIELTPVPGKKKIEKDPDQVQEEEQVTAAEIEQRIRDKLTGKRR